MSDAVACFACLLDVPTDKAVHLHVYFDGREIKGHPFDEDYYYHPGCYEENVRLIR